MTNEKYQIEYGKCFRRVLSPAEARLDILFGA
jgi:hypothetical protein